ncbi:Pectinesterase 2, partial [Bienertia sinuspersici]
SKFLVYQDTLYTKHGTQYYIECDIYGAVDFALVSYQQVTYKAQGRSMDQKSGFTMNGCNFTIQCKVEPIT